MKRAQASIEFMSTYVWAFVGILLAVGALTYYATTIDAGFDRESCDTGAQIRCIDAAGFEDGTYVVQIQNQVNKDIMIKRIELTNQDPPVVLDNIDQFVANGDTYNLIANINKSLDVGSSQEIELTVSYETEFDGRINTIIGQADMEIIAGPNPNINPICGDGYLGPGICDYATSPGPGVPCNNGRICNSECDCVPPEKAGTNWQLPET